MHTCPQLYPKIFYWNTHELNNCYCPHKADVSYTLGYFKQQKVLLLRKLILISFNTEENFLDLTDSIGHIQEGPSLAQNSHVMTNKHSQNPSPGDLRPFLH